MSTDEKVDLLLQKLDVHAEKTNKDLAELKLGVYGNKQNKVKGLIDRQEDDEKRIASLEESRKKIIYWGGGLLAGLQAVAFAIYEWWKK